MRFALPALAVLVLLAGCAPESGPKLHDVTVYGALNARLSYLYGSPRKFDLDGKQVTLTQGTSTAPYAVDSALLVDGQAFVRTSVTPLEAAPVVVSRIPLTTDLRLEARSDVEQVVYFDGSDYFRLVSGAKAGTSQTVVPTPRLNRLRGLGELTDREADALANGLEQGGKPYVLAVLPSTTLPKHSVNGTSEYLQTGVYVQQGLETAAAAPGSAARNRWPGRRWRRGRRRSDSTSRSTCWSTARTSSPTSGTRPTARSSPCRPCRASTSRARRCSPSSTGRSPPGATAFRCAA